MDHSGMQRSGPETVRPTSPVFGGAALRRSAKVLPEHARAHNRTLVLQTLFHHGAMSRADLSRQTGLTRVTISDLISDLIGDGLVAERGVREASGPGKPAILLDLDRDHHRIVGLDLSAADRVLGAVFALDGTILSRAEVAVGADAGALLPIIVQLALGLIADAGGRVLGVGVGTPGVVDADGVVLTAPNFAWRRINLQHELTAALGVPVVVANDANAAVLAEYTFGGAREDVILVRVGRGVGSGLLSTGQPLRGSHFAAGEIGHVTVGTDGGPACICGKVGCLEAWLAVPALLERIAVPGNDRAEVLSDAGTRLGIALAPIVGALDLSEIILAGPPELLEGPLADATAATLRSRTLAEFHDGVQVRMTAQGEDIILRGAAVMVLAEQLGLS